jgi:hypothetical protein
MVDRLVLKMPVRLGPMVKGSPKAQEKCQAAKLQLASQRVEESPRRPFHLGLYEEDVQFRQSYARPEKLVICRAQPHTYKSFQNFCLACAVSA